MKWSVIHTSKRCMLMNCINKDIKHTDIGRWSCGDKLWRLNVNTLMILYELMCSIWKRNRSLNDRDIRYASHWNKLRIFISCKNYCNCYCWNWRIELIGLWFCLMNKPSRFAKTDINKKHFFANIIHINPCFFF